MCAYKDRAFLLAVFSLSTLEVVVLEVNELKWLHPLSSYFEVITIKNSFDLCFTQFLVEWEYLASNHTVY